MYPDVLAPVVRILLRWLGGYLIARGVYVNPDTFTDPDLVSILCYVGAAICGIISEGWYILARKLGWCL